MLKSGILRFALSVVILAIAPLVQADALDDILERGTIRVGVAEFVPWTMRTESDELVGFEIDVARKIASDMNVTPEFKVYEWEKMVPALNQGEIDVIAAGMAITPQSALQVNFTMPLGQSGVSLATNMDKTKNIGSLDDLNDHRVIITVVSDTMAQSVARAFFDEASIRAYPSSAQAEADVLNSRAHAYLASVPEINFLALRNAKKIDVPIREPLVASSEGLAVRKGEQELLNFLNAWVVARQTDKWLATTREYWFNTIEWLPGMRD